MRIILGLKKLYTLLFHKSNPPKNGSHIKITWLPKNNAYPDDNIYIGFSGKVKDSDKNGFLLESSSSILVVPSNKYRYKETNEQV